MNFAINTEEGAERFRKMKLDDEVQLKEKIMSTLGAKINQEIESTRNEIKEVSAFMLKNKNSEDEKIIMEMLVSEKKASRLDDKLIELMESMDQLSIRVAQFVGLAGDYKMAESMLDKITPLHNALVNAVNNNYHPAEQLNRFVAYEIQRYKDIQAVFERACVKDPDIAKAAGIN